MKYYFLGQNCFVYNLGDRLSIDDNLKILMIYKSFKKDHSFCNRYNIYDIVPAYNSIAFHFSYGDILEFKEALLSKIKDVDYNQTIESNIHNINVKYDGQDLQIASDTLGLEVSEIIKRHTQVEYHIAMLGFKPYFPFLMGLDPSLSLPRLETPRNRINAGSVGIGGSQTSIFPEESPSGWNIIGNSKFKDFQKFKPADKIIFKEIKCY